MDQDKNLTIKLQNVLQLMTIRRTKLKSEVSTQALQLTAKIPPTPERHYTHLISLSFVHVIQPDASSSSRDHIFVHTLTMPPDTTTKHD